MQAYAKFDSCTLAYLRDIYQPSVILTAPRTLIIFFNIMSNNMSVLGIAVPQ